MNNLIFFYGSLKREILSKKKNFRDVLLSNIINKDLIYLYDTFILKGRMFLIETNSEKFPGVIIDDNGYPIFGELYKIKDNNILEVLDEYEEVDSGLFKRDKILLGTNECFVYLYNKKTDGLPEIKNGKYSM